MTATPWTQALHTSRHTDWATPEPLFRALDDQFLFELDAAASPENAKCDWFFSAEDDALDQDWSAPLEVSRRPGVPPGDPPSFRTAWLNPPYGRTIGRWLEKAHEEARRGLTVVVLTMACTDTIWWNRWARRSTQIRYLRGRVPFERDGVSGPAPKGSAVLIFTPWWDGPPQHCMDWDWR